MALRGTDPGSYITENNSVYEDDRLRGGCTWKRSSIMTAEAFSSAFLAAPSGRLCTLFKVEGLGIRSQGLGLRN